MPSRLAATIAVLGVVAGALAVAAAPHGAHRAQRRSSEGTAAATAAAPQIVADLRLSSSGRRVAQRTLPGGSWAVSFDVRLAPNSRLQLSLGSPSTSLVLAAGAAAGTADATAGASAAPVPVYRAAGRAFALADRPGWGRGGWRHVELTAGVPAARAARAAGAGGGVTRVLIDGRPLPDLAGDGSTLSLRLSGNAAQVDALIITPAGASADLLLHRLAELHARIAPGRFPAGADLADQLHFSTGWTSGFWAGALWQAAALAPIGGMFERWALAATIAHFGQERADTHDVGFMYGESSLEAWQALCRPPHGPSATCARLRASVLTAADQLRSLAATNPRAGTIPTDAHGRPPTTIVDSMMNLRILTWASQVTGNPAYARLASRHAHAVAALLVRPDGSTAQAVEFDRATGRLLRVGTHQGLSDASTWARGQAWAVYGFAQTAVALDDPSLLAVAQRAAGYVARRLPRGGVPRWDYDASAGPHDVSAGVITAAGLLHLANACRRLRGACPQAAGWIALARRMLDAALGYARDRPPIGLLRSQVLNHRYSRSWDDHAELIFGLTYALEASADLTHGLSADM